MSKVNYIQVNFILLSIVLLFLSACSAKTETTANVLMEASGSGPFFSGPNSLIAEYDVDLSAISGLEGVSSDKLKEIKISAITINLNNAEDVNFDSFSSATLQMVSGDTDMQTIATKNPIDSKNQELVLQVSEEIDIVDYFKGQKFSSVLDLDFIEDSYIEELSATINMQLTVKHN